MGSPNHHCCDCGFPQVHCEVAPDYFVCRWCFEEWKNGTGAIIAPADSSSLVFAPGQATALSAVGHSHTNLSRASAVACVCRVSACEVCDVLQFGAGTKERLCASLVIGALSFVATLAITAMSGQSSKYVFTISGTMLAVSFVPLFCLVLGPDDDAVLDVLDRVANRPGYLGWTARSSPVFRVLSLAGLNATLGSMTIENGYIAKPTLSATNYDVMGGAVAFFGGIESGDTLTIANCDVTDNTVVGGTKSTDGTGGYAYGGALYATGVAVGVSDSSFTYNLAEGGYDQAGLNYNNSNADAVGGEIYVQGTSGPTTLTVK